MKFDIELCDIILVTIILGVLDMFGVQLIYRVTKYHGFFPTLSEAALTKLGRSVYSYMTPLVGMLMFFTMQLIATARVADSETGRQEVIGMRVLCAIAYISMSYQAIVPFNKARKLDSHTVMAGVFMFATLLISIYNTYLGWAVYDLTRQVKLKVLALRVPVLCLMMYCIIRVIPFMFGVLKSESFRHGRVILQQDNKLLTKMGLLQFVAILSLLFYMVSIYLEAKGLHLVVGEAEVLTH